MATKVKSYSVKKTLGPFRLSHAHVHEKALMPDKKTLKYSGALLFSKTTPEGRKVKAELDAMVEEIRNNSKKLVDAQGKKIDLQYLEEFIHDGDAPKKSGDAAYKGMWYVNTKADDKPLLFDAKRGPIMDATQIYSGVWVNANISCYDFDTAGNYGISAGLNALQKVKDDTPLSGNSASAADFEDVNTDDDI